MTTTEPLPPPEAKSPTSDWTQQFAELRARYPKVREPILVALHILTQNPDIALADAKAQAALHGLRITAASIAAAQRLLTRQAPPKAQPPARQARRAAARPAQARTAQATDVVELLRATVEAIEAKADERAERLQDAIRQAVEILGAGLDG